MSFLCGLIEKSESSGSNNARISEMYETILRAAVDKFALRRPESLCRNPRSREKRDPALNGHTLASVVQHCRKVGLDDCISQLISKVLQGIDIMDTKDFPTTILPLLESLLLDIKKGEVQTERFRHLFQSSLVQWITQHVGREPKQANWSREPTRCHVKGSHTYGNNSENPEPCGDCQ
jgi:hypothetical protein